MIATAVSNAVSDFATKQTILIGTEIDILNTYNSTFSGEDKLVELMKYLKDTYDMKENMTVSDAKAKYVEAEMFAYSWRTAFLRKKTLSHSPPSKSSRRECSS